MVRSEKSWWLWSFYMTFFSVRMGSRSAFLFLFGVILRAWRRQVCKGFKKTKPKIFKVPILLFFCFYKSKLASDY